MTMDEMIPLVESMNKEELLNLIWIAGDEFNIRAGSTVVSINVFTSKF